MPRRSTGCEQCRMRKVRCDEHKPQCQRCLDYGVACPGYRPSAEKDLRFVDQTRYKVQTIRSRSSQQHQTNSTNGTREYRWQHHFNDKSKASTPNQISNSSLHRVQLLSTFLDLYLPKRTDEALTSNFDYIAELPQIDLASPLLQISIDTLCLAELGSLYQDERCLRESQTRYVRALPMLARELARPPSKRLRSDNLLAAITILTLCELFDAISRNEETGNGWISHVNGAQQYVKATGTEGIDSSFGWLLFHSVRHSSLCMGFVNRKAVLFAEPKWLQVTAEVSKADQYVALYDIGLQIPGVLEKVDSLADTTNAPQDYVTVCTQLCRLRRELERWFQKFYEDQSAEPYKIVPVRDMTGFARLCLDRTFQTVFSFDSVQSCSQQQLYWICCLVLDFTLIGVYRRSIKSGSGPTIRLEDFTSRSEEDIGRDMFVAATCYCRSLPFCCEPEVGSVGRIGTFLLRLVQSYFEQTGRCRETEWCEAVREMLQSCPQTVTTSKTVNKSVSGVPWKTEHKCKSPVCNFRIECCAPAPLLLAGEYPDKSYKPRHNSRKIIWSALVDSTPDTERMYTIPNRGEIGDLQLPTKILRANGTSALADERVLANNFVPVIEV